MGALSSGQAIGELQFMFTFMVFVFVLILDLLLAVRSAKSQGRVQTAQVRLLPEFSCGDIFCLMNPKT